MEGFKTVSQQGARDNREGKEGPVSGRNGLFHRYAHDFLVFLEVDLRRSPNTLKAYKRVLLDFSAFLSSIGVTDLEKVTKSTIRAFLRHKGAVLHPLRHIGPVSRLSSISSSLKAFWAKTPLGG